MGPDTGRPPTIVFDLDGTLVDTAADLVATLNAIVAPEGIGRVALADGRAMVGHGARAMIESAFAASGQTVGASRLDRLFAAFLAHYGAHMADRSRPFPGVEDALDRFAAAGWRLAVCTNKHEAIARRLLELLGLGQRFAAVTGQDTFGFRKPDPRHLTETIRLAGGSAGRAIMVGDSLTDVDTAIAAAVPVVAVTFGYSAVPPARLGADALIGSFAGLWDAVQGITGRLAWPA
jgi:phosphoglycolate phosphatase